MSTVTDNPLNEYQTKWLAKRSRTVERAFKIINGGRALGLEMLDLDVLGGFRAWDNPENPSGSVVAYAHGDTGLPPQEMPLGISFESNDNSRAFPFSTFPIFTVFRHDEDYNPVERLFMTVETDVDTGREMAHLLDRTEAEVLSPVDTAIELTEADVKPLEHASRMSRVLQVPAEYTGEAEKAEQGGTLLFLEGVLGDRFPDYGHGVKRNGTLYVGAYVGAGEIGSVKAIRPDGTILPVGYSLNDPDSHLDNEYEKVIRPRLEDLRS